MDFIDIMPMSIILIGLTLFIIAAFVDISLMAFIGAILMCIGMILKF